MNETTSLKDNTFTPVPLEPTVSSDDGKAMHEI